MATLSAIVITMNEEKRIGACLESLAGLADEIVVLDSGSQDKTLDIARKYTDKVFISDDWPGFGKQKQSAQAYTSGDWIISIDADEVVSPELSRSIKEAVRKDDRSLVYALARTTWFFGSFIRHSGWYPDYVIRLFPKDRTGFDDALVHEKVLVPEGIQQKTLTGDLYHFTFTSMEQWLVKTAYFARLWADERAAKGKKSSLIQAVSHALAYFVKTYFFKRGFLDGRPGFLLAVLGAYSRLIKYADLWSRSLDQSDRS